MSMSSIVLCLVSSTDCFKPAGVRQVVTGLAELKRKDQKLLVTSMCIGSGMGAAGIFVNEARR